MSDLSNEDTHTYDNHQTSTDQHEYDHGIQTSDSGLPVTVVIADALAASEHSTESPLENRPLYEYIDPDALETLIQRTPPTTNLYIEFEINDTMISVSGNGTVLVGSRKS